MLASFPAPQFIFTEELPSTQSPSIGDDEEEEMEEEEMEESKISEERAFRLGTDSRSMDSSIEQLNKVRREV